MRSRIPTLLTAVALGATACTGGTDTSADTTPEAPSTTRDGGAGAAATSGGDAGGAGGGGVRFVRGLERFDDCAAFLDHVQFEARDRVGAYGLDGQGGYWFEDVAMEEPAEEPASESADASTAAPAPSAGALGGSDGDDIGSFSGTNVQVAGVDEPDIVKTDGERILTISDNVLSHVDISSGEPVLTDQLRLTNGWGHELFFRGDRALLFTNAGTWGYPMPIDDLAIDPDVDTGGDAEAEFASGSVPPTDFLVPDGGWGPAAEILEIDLSDPEDLQIAGSMRIEGQYLSARAIGDHVRLAVNSSPTRLPWLYPQSPAGEARAEEANRQTVDSTTVEDWLPAYEFTGPGGSSSGQLLDCSSVHHPADFAGFDVVSVIDLDLGRGLGAAVAGGNGSAATSAAGVLASGQTVASSMDRFYVATTRWQPPLSGDDSVDDDRFTRWRDDFVTEIHAFAIAPGAPTTYVGSGSVPGSLLNQFSLDEYEGDLRVVHTDGGAEDGNDLSETFLTVLREDGDELIEVGSVGGLGRGEQLYSARLLGDIGFAVTFRQIDPFYVLDLSDPTAPRVAGELKIPGFSTYLHPVGDHLVLGLGQDATEDGRTTGLKLSLFDVSDPARPNEVAVWAMPDANSPAEWDHRAFQMWDSTAIVPVQSWAGDVNGALLFDLRDGITEIGRVSHVAPGDEPSSDCRVIDGDSLTPDGSELYWIAQDGHVQVCGPDDVGGWAGSTCEPIQGDQIDSWFWDAEARNRDLEVLGLRPGDVVELCWPDGGSQEAIQRSLIADGTLYTVSASTLQANDLDGLAVLGRVALR